jgi:hypothetical protein
MKKNCFSPVMRESPPNQRARLRIPEPAAGSATFALVRRADGTLVDHPGAYQPLGGSALLGYVRISNGGGETGSECVFVAHQPHLVVNGLTPPLPAMTLEPGALLSFRGDFWQYAIEWTPEVSEPPEHLRQKPCPVCGCPLEAAPAVQCLCGRWSHLQNPATPDDPEALNCFLHAEKCQCQRKSSLTPLVEPELPPSLTARASWDEW